MTDPAISPVVTSEPATIERPITPVVTVTPPAESAETVASLQDTNDHKASTIDEAIANFNEAVGKPELEDEPDITNEASSLSAVEADAVAVEGDVAASAIDETIESKEEVDRAETVENEQSGDGKAEENIIPPSADIVASAAESTEDEPKREENGTKDEEADQTGVSTPSGAETPVERVATPPHDVPTDNAPPAETTPFRRPPPTKNKKKNKKKKNAQAQAQAQEQAGDEDVEGDGKGMDEIDLN